MTPLVVGALLVAAFVAWELRTPSPMLPMQFFRNRTFALTNVASLFMFFGMFGSIFLLAQFFQTVQGYSPLQSGLRILPWTAMPIFIAPIAGALSDRIGGQRLMAAGLALQSAGLIWIAAVSTVTTPYIDLVVPFALSGFGMSLFFAPVANVVLELGAARPGGQGLRRDERDPRARRRLRRRGARLGLRAGGRLPHARDVRARNDDRGLHRRRARRGRRGCGGADQGPPAARAGSSLRSCSRR